MLQLIPLLYGNNAFFNSKFKDSPACFKLVSDKMAAVTLKCTDICSVKCQETFNSVGELITELPTACQSKLSRSKTFHKSQNGIASLIYAEALRNSKCNKDKSTSMLPNSDAIIGVAEIVNSTLLSHNDNWSKLLASSENPEQLSLSKLFATSEQKYGAEEAKARFLVATATHLRSIPSIKVPFYTPEEIYTSFEEPKKVTQSKDEVSDGEQDAKKSSKDDSSIDGITADLDTFAKEAFAGKESDSSDESTSAIP